MIANRHTDGHGDTHRHKQLTTHSTEVCSLRSLVRSGVITRSSVTADGPRDALSVKILSTAAQLLERVV